MRTARHLALAALEVLVSSGASGLYRLHGASTPPPRMAAATPNIGVAPQYDTAHVYVAPEDFDRFVASLVATFGGTTTKQGVFTVTPTPSSTISQLVLTPAGTVSVFGFKTPLPYPFGAERTGYLVTDMDTAIRAARATGADVIVAPFNDPIGRDAVIQWPGGVNTQLYWHTTAPSYPTLKTIPENRVYLSTDRGATFTRSFLAFSHGKVTSDDVHAPGIEIGRQADTYRRIPDRFAVRQDGRACDGWPSSIPLWPGDDRIRGGEPHRYAWQSNNCQSNCSGGSIYSRSAQRGQGDRVRIAAVLPYVLLMEVASVHADPCWNAGPVVPNRTYKLLTEDEDWSFLRDPALRQDFWDPLKYIRLRNGRDDWYVSFGAWTRQDFERIGNDYWGQQPIQNAFFLQRYMAYADIHYGKLSRAPFSKPPQTDHSQRSSGACETSR